MPLEVDTRGATQIGELAVHRESLDRVLRENPQYLRTILEAVVNALNRNSFPLTEEPQTTHDCALCEV